MKQHEDNYRDSIKAIISNNTISLVDQDLASILNKPPLDSMDNLRIKLLDLAKKNKFVLNTENLDSLLDKYRSYILKCCDVIRKERINSLNLFTNHKNSEVIKINKKDFADINKNIKKILKGRLVEGFNKVLERNIKDIISGKIDDSIIEKYIIEFTKYYNGSYLRQIVDNFELKIMVKDTTLMNAIKEQGERYLFTLNHSHLLNDMDA